MTIQEAQQEVDQWINSTGVRYFNELTNLGILMEEVGELSRLMVRQYGEQSSKERVGFNLFTKDSRGTPIPTIFEDPSGKEKELRNFNWHNKLTNKNFLSYFFC